MFAPSALKVALEPEQTDQEEEEVVNVGEGVTASPTVLLFTHKPKVPVTV